MVNSLVLTAANVRSLIFHTLIFKRFVDSKMSEEFESLKKRFLEEFSKLVSSKDANSFYMSETQYNKFLTSVKDAKIATQLSSVQRRRLQRFDIFSIGGTEKLIVPLKAGKFIIDFFFNNCELLLVLNIFKFVLG